MSPYIYDLSPYADIAYYQTHPGHLAAVSLARGHDAPVGKVRVLEIGCGSGFNLIAMSMGNPQNEYTGLDLSHVQIENGRNIAAQVSAQNISLHACSLEDFPDDGSQFDYIIAHGFYCWVPPAVRDAMFSLMRKRLAPKGVAYVSYNTYPGWRMRGLMRDAMCFLSEGSAGAEERVAKARQGTAQLADAFLDAEGLVARAFREEWGNLKDEQDYYLLHEYLGEHCEPLYFSDFAKHAAGHGLQFLGEARYWTNSHAQPERVREDLARVGGEDLLRREQYLDWKAGRYFRQTLLCHAEREITGKPDPEAVAKLYVLADPDTPSSIGEPMRDAVLERLAEAAPEPITVGAIGEALFGPMAFLAPPLLVQGWAETHWALRADSPQFAVKAGDHPEACPLARMQARTSNELTNRLHRWISVSDEERALLLQLDGTRSAVELEQQGAILDSLARKALLAR